MILRWYHGYYWISALLVIAGIEYTYLWWGQGLFAQTVKIPINPPFFIGVYPVSLVLIGAALAVYTWKFRWRGLPLVLMLAGIFDLDFPTNPEYGPIRIVQVGLAVGGFVGAGAPMVKSGWYVGGLFAVYCAVISGYVFYWGYEAALLVFGFYCLEFPDTDELVSRILGRFSPK